MVYWVEQVSRPEAIEMDCRLARKVGLPTGISRVGGALAVRLAEQDELAGKTIVVILPECRRTLFSTALFEGLHTCPPPGEAGRLRPR